jgi:hypothetical protein
MSMPSFDYFRGSPATEILRIESEPPGADARTAEGQSCRTPCELTVAANGDVAISFALQGYNPQTINVRADGAAGSGGPTRMQPNPVFAELTPTTPPRQKKKSAPKKNIAAKKAPSGAAGGPPPSQSGPDPATAYPSNYPWPPPPPPQQ